MAGRVVVGVDGSPEADRALLWAAREAATRQDELAAVVVWTWDRPALVGAPVSLEPDQARAHAERILAEAVARVQGEYPTMTVTATAVEGYAPDVLVEAARDADLLVLASHGHGRLYHTVLGSVAETCVRKATCPVVVVPAAMAHATAGT
jgi:nucleotide-binding universal stress UspA family protein